MTFRQMEVFIAVCKCKSISKASAVYHVSQQGISKMIRELEAELGCQTALQRYQRRIPPHLMGAYFLNECQTIIERKNHMCSHIAQIKNIPKETIFLGMAFGVVSALPYQLITDFENTHPNVKIEHADHTDFYLEELALKDEFDFCITTGVIDSDLVFCYTFTSRKGIFVYPKGTRIISKK